MTTPNDPQANPVVRHAVEAFAATPDQRRMADVLRACMYGTLLFDVTGSDLAIEDGAFRPGSQLRIRRGTGPDGKGAAFAFTSNEAIAKLYPSGTPTQSWVTPAIRALELARSQQEGWLYIDPAGPTCALAVSMEVDFALRNPNNQKLKTALAAFAAQQASQEQVLTVFVEDGPLLISVDESTAPGEPRIRLTTLPDGSAGLLGFTSAPEVLAAFPGDSVGRFTCRQLIAMIRERNYGGIVINPAGPFVVLTAAEINAAAART